MERIVIFFLTTIIYTILSVVRIERKTKRILFILFVSFLLIVTSGLRGISMGSDTLQYYVNFESAKSYTIAELWLSFIGEGEFIKDPFYWIFQKLFQFVSPNFNYYLLFVAILFFVTLGWFMYKNNHKLKDLYISYIFYLGLFYGFYSLTGTRQTIATVFILIAYRSLMKKRYLVYIVLTFFASFFHISALVFLLALPMAFVKKAQYLSWGVALSLPIIFVNRVPIFSELVELGGFEDRFMLYMDEGYGGSVIVSSFYVITLLGVIINMKSISNNEEMLFHSKMYLLCGLGLPLMFISGTGMRVTQYFALSMFILIPFFVERMKFRGNYFIVSFIMLLLIYIGFGHIEYTFYWEEPNYIFFNY